MGTELNIGFNSLETMVATLEYRNVCARWATRILTQEHKEHRSKFDRTYWTNTRLKVTVSWIASSPVTKRGVITTSRSQKGNPLSGFMWIPHRRKNSRRCPQRVKWCALSFGIGKGQCFGFPWTRTNHQLWPPLATITKLKARIFSQAKEEVNISLATRQRQAPYQFEDRGAHWQSWLDCRITPTV
jgi:hypothetical protein